MKVVITGSRNGWTGVGLFLDSIHAKKPITMLVHGACRGVDSQAHRWALGWKIPIKTYPAEWAIYNKKAGPIRNEKMLSEHPDATVIVFPGGDGTRDCYLKAKEKGMPIIICQDMKTLESLSYMEK